MRTVGVIAMMLVLCTLTIGQGTASASLFGPFTNLRYVDEGAGDIIGYEVTIIPQYRQPYAIFQCAEGVPSDPILVPLHVENGTITFTVEKTGMCDGNYHASLAKSGLRLRATNRAHPEYLLRTTSYWSKR